MPKLNNCVIVNVAAMPMYLRPYDSEGRVTQVSANGGSRPLWSADGRELFFRRWEDDSVHAAGVSFDGAALSVESPRMLFSEADYGSSTPIGSWSVGPDGRFVIRRAADDEVRRGLIKAMYPETIQIVQGWFEELEELAPSP